MDRRRFLILSTLSPVAAMIATPGTSSAATVAASGGHSFGFAPDGSAFLLDGQPFQIRSGEMHCARIPRPYWRHRIRMAKAMGLNTISMYLMWNYYEEKPGVWDFTTERRDFVSFIRLCQQEGMWVLLRPGPFIDGEWDLGGIPSWLLRYPDIQLRVSAATDPHYMPAVQDYIAHLAPRIKPLLVANGGPVLMVQVENEYGSYGNDTTYMAEVQQAWLDNGIEGPFYTEDGLPEVEANHTNVPGGAIGLSGGDASTIVAARRAFPTVPAMDGEVYPGWLTHWDDPEFMGLDYDISGTLQGVMNAGYSFNIYVAHGGTNYGYWAGANANNNGSGWVGVITSYDYSAPITEQGAQGPRYTVYRDLLASYVGTLPAIPDPIPTMTPDPVTPRVYASVWDNLPPRLPASQTVNPQPFEMYGQDYGFILYRKRLAGYSGGTLDVQTVHDYATIFLRGDYQGGLSRSAMPSSVSTALNVAASGATTLALDDSGRVGTNPVLDILVEGMGRVCYGHALVDRKGILESASLTDAASQTTQLTDWEAFLLPMDEKYLANLRPNPSHPQRPGLFFKATLKLAKVADTYLDMSNWTKGLVWVNGTNLGRYWKIGPQQRLYCPATFLRPGPNEILVFDHHQTQGTPIGFATALTDKPPVITVTPASPVVQPGQSTGVAVTVTNNTANTLKNTQLSLQADTGWQITPASVSLGTLAPGATANANATLTAPSASGLTTVTATATYSVVEDVPPDQATGTGAVSVPFPNLAASFGNVGITDDTNTNVGNVDGDGSSFSAQALASVGASAGGTVTFGGSSFTWPAAAAGQPDNTVAAGQAIAVNQSGSTLAFLITTTYGPSSGTGTVLYTDGSAQSFTLSAPDWYGTAPAGSDPAIIAPYRNRPGNTQDQHTVNVFYSATTLDPTKVVADVVLPDISSASVSSGTAALHVFAMSIS